MTRRLAPLALAALLTSGPLGAGERPPLAEDRAINHGLAVIAIADRIRKECDGVSARMFRAFGVMRSLRSAARKAGYPDAEIRAFVEDSDEKARVEGLAKAYLRRNGAAPGQPESYCAVGRAEIERNSEIGVLLRRD